MNFDVQKQELDKKLQALPGLSKALHDLAQEESVVADEPAKRVVLPYQGPRAFTSSPWKDK